MIILETHYLVDYENGGGNSLRGCENLSGTDHIHIFYTDNSKKVTLDIFENYGKASLETKKVSAGDQSLDKHLIAYLGYLVGKNSNKKVEYVIISSDKGYDNVNRFLQEYEKGISVSRRSTIAVKKVTQKNEVKQNTEKKTTVAKVNPDKKTELNQQVQQALSRKNYEARVINEVAKVVTSLYGNEKFMCDVHNALRNKYSNYLEVYGDIKPVISKY